MSLYSWHTAKTWPNQQQHATLRNWCELETELWRKWAGEREDGVTHGQQSREIKKLKNDPKYAALPRNLMQSTLWALHKSWTKAKSNKQRIQRSRYALEFDTKGWQQTGTNTLDIDGVGSLHFRGAAPITNARKLTLVWEDGHWFIHFATTKRIASHQIDPSKAVGLDPGLWSWITSSDGETWDHHLRSGRLVAEIKKVMDAQSRRRPGSRKHAEGKNRLNRLRRKLRNCQYNELHAIARDLCDRYDVIAIEGTVTNGRKLNTSDDYKVARRLANWPLMITIIGNEAERRGKQFVEVPPFYTTRTCSECGSVKDALKHSDRVFVCDSCGFTLDRDVNAARNIRNKGLEKLGY